MESYNEELSLRFEEGRLIRELYEPGMEEDEVEEDAGVEGDIAYVPNTAINTL